MANELSYMKVFASLPVKASGLTQPSVCTRPRPYKKNSIAVLNEVIKRLEFKSVRSCADELLNRAGFASPQISPSIR